MPKTIVTTLAGVATILLSVGVALAGPAPTAVPEPATLSLLAGSMGVLAVARYLRRKK